MPDQVKAISHPWRRHLRFSVRGLISVVLLIGIGLGWWIHRARVQRDAVAAIRRAHGSVRYNIWFTDGGLGFKGNSWLRGWLINLLDVDYLDTVTVVHLGPALAHRDPWYHGPFDNRDFNPILAHVAHLSQLQWLDLSDASVTDADLAHLRGLSNLRRLILRGTDVTDAGLANLKGLNNLQKLELQRTQITDAGLSNLDPMTSLKMVALDGTQITDAGLAHLKNRINLTSLYLGGTKVTDAGLVYLEGLAGLQYLDLADTQVTDAGLAHLKGLYKLSILDLRGTKVTDAGIEELEGALPSLTIKR